MKISQRDRRALILLGAAAAVALVVHFWPGGESGAQAAVPGSSIPLAEKRLARLRQMLASSGARRNAREQAASDLALREKGMLEAETAAQAQAQMLQILRKLAKAQAPPLEIRGVEIGPARPLGDDYGEVLIAVNFEARIEQLVNLLADLSAQPELLATQELRVTGASPKEKYMPVRLTVSGIVPKRLLPQKKGFTF